MSHLPDAAVERLRRALAAPDTGDGRYRVLEAIGEGGMGTVYRAEDLQLGREVALKVLPLEQLAGEPAARLAREALVLARLEHPGIVPVHDLGTMPDGRVYYAMKLVRGRRLDAFAGAATPLRERLRMFLRVCEAVAFAHAAGVIHRDLKPENVMVGAFGEVLTMDWGVARLGRVAPGAADGAGVAGPGAAAGPERRTRAGTVIGTPAYMAPEQARGDVDAVDERTDVYGLGGTLHFLLAAAPPGEGSLEPAPPPLRSIVRRALAADPGARYPHVAELAADVQRFLDGERVLAHRETAIERLNRITAPHRTAIVLVLVYALSRALLLVLFRR